MSIDSDIKEVREQIEAVVLVPKAQKLCDYILEHPQETYAECCKSVGYKGTSAILKTGNVRKYLSLRRELMNLYATQKAILTKDDVLVVLKEIIANSDHDRTKIQSLALAAKILGLEAPIKSEVVTKTLTVSFEEDKLNG